MPQSKEAIPYQAAPKLGLSQEAPIQADAATGDVNQKNSSRKRFVRLLGLVCTGLVVITVLAACGEITAGAQFTPVTTPTLPVATLTPVPTSTAEATPTLLPTQPPSPTPQPPQLTETIAPTITPKPTDINEATKTLQVVTTAFLGVTPIPTAIPTNNTTKSTVVPTVVEIVNKLYETPDKAKQENFLSQLGDPKKYQIEVGVASGVGYKPYPGEIFYSENIQGQQETGVRMSAIFASRPYAIDSQATWLNKKFGVKVYVVDIALPVRTAAGEFIKNSDGTYIWGIAQLGLWFEDTNQSLPLPFNFLAIAEQPNKSFWNSDLYDLTAKNGSPTTSSKGNDLAEYSKIRDTALGFFQPGKITVFALTYNDSSQKSLGGMTKEYAAGNELEKRQILLRSLWENKIDGISMPSSSAFQNNSNHDGKTIRFVNAQAGTKQVLGISINLLQLKDSPYDVNTSTK